MNSTICSHCRLSLRRTLRATRIPHSRARPQSAAQSTAADPSSLSEPNEASEPKSKKPYAPSLSALLSKPSWSVRSLLPPSPSPPPPPSSPSNPNTDATTTTTTTISPQTLHHLLRLSALPLPNTPEEEYQMLSTLSSQLHFVRAIQAVDTSDVIPLSAIRDETRAGEAEQAIGVEDLQAALDVEEYVGHARRPRRRRDLVVGVDAQGRGEQEQVPNAKEKETKNEVEDWDVLGGASETAAGRYFVVRSGSSATGTANSPKWASVTSESKTW
ncbi:hypothetical protein F4808DRAFT_158467 [Astrocystis sublimbata]|nr:hypothetical protein F4808DRAFT_158467 [Astrocystis sublimbata]